MLEIEEREKENKQADIIEKQVLEFIQFVVRIHSKLEIPCSLISNQGDDKIPFINRLMKEITDKIDEMMVPNV